MSRPIFNNYKTKIIIYYNNLKHKNSRKHQMMVNKLKDRNPIYQAIIRLTF